MNTDFNEGVEMAHREGQAWLKDQLRDALEKLNTDLSHGLEVYSPDYGYKNLEAHYDALERKGYLRSYLSMDKPSKPEVALEKTKEPAIHSIENKQPKRPRL